MLQGSRPKIAIRMTHQMVLFLQRALRIFRKVENRSSLQPRPVRRPRLIGMQFDGGGAAASCPTAFWSSAPLLNCATYCNCASLLKSLLSPMVSSDAATVKIALPSGGADSMQSRGIGWNAQPGTAEARPAGQFTGMRPGKRIVIFIH
jgi:hypothetical protein